MSQQEIYINSALLRLRREARGWVLNDLATRACMSVKQIRQLEEGGLSAFYSQAVKLTAAKKVGSLLGLSTDEVFTEPQAETLSEPVLETDMVAKPEADDFSSENLPRSEELNNSVAYAEPKHIETVSTIVDVAPAMPLEEPKKSKTSLWLIAGLFVAALCVAAYLQPQDEPVSAEPAPPLQVVPSESAESASSPESSASTASAPVEPASVTKSVASAVMPVASSARPTASAVITSPALVRSPSSAPSQISPSASAASKAL
jgi:cytoskeleton protein RodZ